MKKFLILLAGLSFTAPAMARAPACVMSKVQDSSGATITLASGFFYMVNLGRDRVTAGLWRPLDKVRVCRGAGGLSVITNLSLARPATITAVRQ